MDEIPGDCNPVPRLNVAKRWLRLLTSSYHDAHIPEVVFPNSPTQASLELVPSNPPRAFD